MLVTVSLPSGRGVDVTCSPEGLVRDLEVMVQKELGPLTLAKGDGQILDPTWSLKDAKVEDGDCITGIRQLPELTSTTTGSAFVLWCHGKPSTPITWGNAAAGESTSVQGHLRLVDIQASLGAFAALSADGRVVTWGEERTGGDSRIFHSQLVEVKQICASSECFAAVKEDGTVLTWGQPYGTFPPGLMDNVRFVASTDTAFAAVKMDGTIRVWGDPKSGGSFCTLRGVQESQALWPKKVLGTEKAFAALLEDGRICSWGHLGFGGGARLSVCQQLFEIDDLFASGGAFAALKQGGVITWGSGTWGGNSEDVQQQLVNVETIHGSWGAFGALLADQTVVCWGSPAHGGDCSHVQAQLTDIKELRATRAAFAALKEDGSVIAWGHHRFGGDTCQVTQQLRNVYTLRGSHHAFAAIKVDGSIVTWGGDSDAIRGKL